MHFRSWFCHGPDGNDFIEPSARWSLTNVGLRRARLLVCAKRGIFEYARCSNAALDAGPGRYAFCLRRNRPRVICFWPPRWILREEGGPPCESDQGSSLKI